ncbi:CHAT domain-containing protein [Iningainema tapete]|uniref:CHAT domain-containing protein n=1 Tax=Iningainema tapete TaxID=2806730 RepID=UPI003080CA27
MTLILLWLGNFSWLRAETSQEISRGLSIAIKDSLRLYESEHLVRGDEEGLNREIKKAPLKLSEREINPKDQEAGEKKETQTLEAQPTQTPDQKETEARETPQTKTPQKETGVPPTQTPDQKETEARETPQTQTPQKETGVPPTQTPEPQPTPPPTQTPEPQPTPSPTQTPTQTPEPQPTPSPTQTPEPQPTPPTPPPTQTPEPQPTPLTPPPTQTPEPQPTPPTPPPTQTPALQLILPPPPTQMPAPQPTEERENKEREERENKEREERENKEREERERREECRRLIKEGDGLINVRNFLDAEAKFREAIESCSFEVELYYKLGNTLLLLGKYEDANVVFQKAFEINSQYTDALDEAINLGKNGILLDKGNQPTSAISDLKQSAELILQIRQGLKRQVRQNFIQSTNWILIHLVNLLIKQQQFDEAFDWINLFTTTELADYTRLFKAKVRNKEAQKALEQWNQLNEKLQMQRQKLQEQQLQGKFSEELSQQVNKLQTKVYKKAEDISRRFPEVAELYETTPKDIADLKDRIPVGTTVIHPVLLTGVKDAPNTIALFVIANGRVTVKLVPVDPEQLNQLLIECYTSLTNRLQSEYLDNLEKLYDQLIRPIETEIQANQPKQLSIIATGKLRYIPFEALYDSKTEQYLIQKYPISYLTRLSVRSLQTAQTGNVTASRRVFAIGNPITKGKLTLSGAEKEVQRIKEILPESKVLIREQATLDAFKNNTPHFPIIHLATHGCFQYGGCDELGLKENTLVFSDKKLKISDAALLGLENVDLIVLSACQTALRTYYSGKPIITDHTQITNSPLQITGVAYLFERAGAKAVIGNLWSVDDKTSQQIIVDFYSNLTQSGMSKVEALQKAKLKQIKSHPWFWAPLVLIGDPR